MGKHIRFVGLDVHAESICVGVAEPECWRARLQLVTGLQPREMTDSGRGADLDDAQLAAR